MSIKKMKKFASACVLISLLGACGTDRYGNPVMTKGDWGTILGGATGAAVGSSIGGGSGRVLAIATGTVLGAIAGSSVGHSMDREDVRQMSYSQNHALEHNRSGQRSTWHNPDTGARGVIEPIKTYKSHGKQCREFTQTVTVGGKSQQAYGYACRQPDGNWLIQDHPY